MAVLVALLLVASTPAASQPVVGYVVKVESGVVYLDLGEKAATVGQPFTVFKEGPELKHPVTGAALGKTETTLGEGAVERVFPLYSTGVLRTAAAGIEPGMRARLGARPEAEARAPAAAAKDGSETRQPRWMSQSFDFKIVGMAVAGFAGDGKLSTALADERVVRLYAYPPSGAPLAEYKLPGVTVKVLGLSAADLNGNGRPELFVTLFNEGFARAETTALELESGAWKRVADIPWMVRAYQDPKGAWWLAAQQLREDGAFPFSGIFPLVWKDGKYGPGSPAIRHKRVDFLFDFTTASLDGAPAAVTLTGTNLLRLQFDKGAWKSSEPYGQTPTRIRWQGKLLEFHPQFAFAYPGGKAAMYGIRNLSMLGSLSEPFGMFHKAELHRKSWNGVALATDWKAELGGYAAGVAPVPPLEPTDVAVSVTGASGRSAVWIFDP